MTKPCDSMLAASRTAPGVPGKPYVVQSLCGEIIYIPCSRSVQRLLVTGRETDDAFAIVGTGGTAGDPIGFHYHREAHDIFLCIKGHINVWAGDQCRTLSSGDLASVPPGVIHQYQILGQYTEFVGLIVPGGWEEFFRFIGEPYDGPLFPLQDDRNIFEVLIPKLKAAAEKFDMIPVPQHPSIEPQPWSPDGGDSNLPGKCEAYFLRAGTAPMYSIGGLIVSLLVGDAESGGRFTIGSIESSSWHEQSNPLAGAFAFHDTHHAIYLAEGSVTLTLNGSEAMVIASGEIAYIPKGTTFSASTQTRYAKAYVFSNGQGLISLLTKVGVPGDRVIPQKASSWNVSDLVNLQTEFNVSIK